MALRFIIGRAGSGKTTYCLNSIRKELQKSPEGDNLILLVPEQATFQNEMELASTPGLEGMIRAQVLSFRRLAWHVLQETGGGARVHIGELGKYMIIRHFLDQRKPELKIFGSTCDQPGFVEKLAGTISELKMYQICISDLDQVLQNHDKDSLLFTKLQDLNLIYKDLEEYLKTKYLDPDDYLNLLAEKVHLSSIITNSEIWIDGFTGFTPQELKVIGELLSTANRVNVAITLDPQDIEKHSEGFLKMTFKTYQKIKQLAETKGIPVEEPVLLSQELYRFSKSPGLKYLEGSFFNLKAEPYSEQTSDLKIISAQNHRAEVESVAREIISLCREKGYRFRDIGVLVRDFNHYDLLLETIFTDYDIPYFTDKKRKVSHHPLVELVRSALEVVKEGWNYEAVFRYLKTDLINISRSEVDILENHVLKYGIKGTTWYKDESWQYGFKELDEEVLEFINELRWKAITELKAFQDKIENSSNVLEMARAIYELFVDLNISQKLKNWGNKALEEGKLEIAKEHKKIWDDLIDILDQVVEILGENVLTLDSFTKIINSGLENIRLGLIPPGFDQVVIGSLERSRNPNLKAVFIIGVGEGILPKRPISEGLFDDSEREILKEIGLELSPDTREKLLDEEFLIYTALTRASEYLVLSYPLADSEGRALKPSLVIKRLKELFPQIKEENVGIEPDGQDELAFINHPRKALAYLGTKLRQFKEGHTIDAIWWGVYQWFLENEEEKEGLIRVIKGLFHNNQVNAINPHLAKKLFANPFRVSISRIEKFQSCPFSHFLSYGLRLKEREVFRLTKPDLGEFFHEALDKLAQRLEEENKDWASLNKKDALEITGSIVEEIIPEINSKVLLSTARLRYLTKKFKKTVQRAATILVEHARRGKFKPVGIELFFGPEGKLPGLKFRLEDGTEMELIGRIDRVDSASKNNKYFLRVIDYKSGKAGLSMLEVYYGIKLQLLAYLDLVLTYAHKLIGSDEVLPAGILYFYLKDPLINEKGPLEDNKIEEEILKAFKMQGLVLADREVFQLFDEQTQKGWSPVIPVGIKSPDKNAKEMFYKGSKVVSLEQIEILRKHIRQVFLNSGESIIKGDVSIQPYKLKDAKACDYCPFLTVCQFDSQLENNNYRVLSDLNEEKLWDILKGGINLGHLD